MPRLAANLGMLFAELPLLERFAAAHRAGFDAVELLFPYDQPATAVRAELDLLGLTMLGINTPPGREGEAGLAAVPGREREFAATFEQALDYAIAIGARQIHCLSGVVAEEQRQAAHALLVRNVRWAAERAGALGIRLLLEPINLRDRPGYFLNGLDLALAVIDEAGHSNVAIQFDCYHQQILRGDLIHHLERHLPRIAHVQIAGVPGRTEPDRGEVHYPGVLEALDRLGYTGFVAAEYRPAGRTEDGLQWARAWGVTPRPA